MRRLALLVLVLAPLPAPAQAGGGAASQPADSAAFAVEGAEAVVTAGRLPGEAARTGRHVTVLTAAEIARSPARSLDELLRFEAGVLTTSRSAFGAQADLSLRGGTFNGVVVLVDGARFNDPMTGHFLSDFPVPLAEIARVEVLRGPDAAAWGPDALGGVVHVLTHTGARTASRDAVRADVSVGEEATVLGELAVRRRGAVAWSAAVAGVRTDGPPALDGDGRPVVGSDGPVRADLTRGAATAAFAAPALGGRLYVRAAGDARDFGAYQFYTPFASDTAREATSTLWAQAQLAGDAGAPATWSVQLSARRHTDRYTYYPGFPTNEHTSRRVGLTAEAAQAVAPGLTVGGGVSAEARDIVSNSLGDHGDVAGGVFALARWSPLRAVTLSMSARLDADPGFGVEPTPMLAVAWAVRPGLGLRAAAGRAVRAPTYVERYINTARENPQGNLGTPGLRAERAWNAEGGLDWAPAPGLALQATAFWRRTDDLIDYVRTEATGARVFLAQNVFEAEAAGVEATASADWRFSPEQALRLSAAYTYTDVQIDPGAFDAGDFKYVLDHSPHLVQGRAAVEAGHALLSVEALHKTRLALDAVTVAHARLALGLRPHADRPPAQVYVEARNVFDARYTEVFGAPMPGRLWLAGLRLRLGA